MVKDALNPPKKMLILCTHIFLHKIAQLPSNNDETGSIIKFENSLHFLSHWLLNRTARHRKKLEGTKFSRVFIG